MILHSGTWALSHYLETVGLRWEQGSLYCMQTTAPKPSLTAPRCLLKGCFPAAEDRAVLRCLGALGRTLIVCQCWAAREHFPHNCCFTMATQHILFQKGHC